MYILLTHGIATMAFIKINLKLGNITIASRAGFQHYKKKVALWNFHGTVYFHVTIDLTNLHWSLQSK